MKPQPMTLRFRWKPAIQVFSLIMVTAPPTTTLGDNPFSGIGLPDIIPKLPDIIPKFPIPKPRNNPGAKPYQPKLGETKNETELRIFQEAVAIGAVSGAVLGNVISKKTGGNRTQVTIFGGMLGTWLGAEVARQQIKNLRNAKMENQQMSRLLNKTRQYNSSVRTYNNQLKLQINQLNSTLRVQSTQRAQKQRQLKQQSAQNKRKQRQLQQQLAQLAQKQHKSPQLAQRQRQLQQQSAQLAQKQRQLQQQSAQLTQKQRQIKQQLGRVASGAQNKKKEVASTINNRNVIAGALEPTQQKQLKREIQILEKEEQKLNLQLAELKELNKTVRIGA